MGTRNRSRLSFAVLMALLSLQTVGCTDQELAQARNITSTALLGAGQIAVGVLGAIGTPGTQLASNITAQAVGGVNQLTTGILDSVRTGQGPGGVQDPPIVAPIPRPGAFAGGDPTLAGGGVNLN